MANGITTAFWSVTINNPDERDLAIVRNGYPDYCREIVHTIEEGEKGTPHIQAWIKLQRQQRMSFVRKLFPGGHFKPLTSDEYIQNTKVYAQKLDSTARSGAVHKFNDPVQTLESVCRRVGERVAETQRNYDDKRNYTDWDKIKTEIQRDMVANEDFRFAKVFVSATYKQMWKEYGVEMCIYFATHTHTHTQEEENVSQVDIPTNAGDTPVLCEQGEEGEQEEGEGDEDDYECGSSEDETDDESRYSVNSEGSDE